MTQTSRVALTTALLILACRKPLAAKEVGAIDQTATKSSANGPAVSQKPPLPNASQPKPVPASPGGTGTVRPQILRIIASGTLGAFDSIAVTVRANAPVVTKAVNETPGRLPRLSIDLPGVIPGRTAALDVGRGGLARVRVVQASAKPLVTRVVFDMTEPLAYELRPIPKNGRELVVVFRPLLTASATVSILSPSLVMAVSTAPMDEILAEDADQIVAPIGTPAPMAMAPRPWGRASFYVNTSHYDNPGFSPLTTNELISSVSYQLPDRDDDGVEYGLDVRHSKYSTAGRTDRVSIYDGFVGARFGDGKARVRGGHMWLNDLGALGSVAGGLVEVGASKGTGKERGRIRFGAFGGLEPNGFETGYAPNVRKIGAYAALERGFNRRHVVGYVNVGNSGLTERSVVTMTNFIPAGDWLFIYQAAEYDLQGPAGQGAGGLTYFFSNARFSATSRLEFQGTYNRGRSIDVRGVSDDILNGRPVTIQAIDGLLWESVGGRITGEVFRRVRIYGGYTQDKNNRDDVPTGRVLVGGHASDIAGTGIDVSASRTRMERPTGNYTSTYYSVGKQFGGRVYVNVDYATSLSLIQFSRSDGIIVEMRPHTRQIGSSGTITLSRVFSLLVTAERTEDDPLTQYRSLAGLTMRFQ